MKKGIVIKSTGSWFTVKSEDNELINCKIKGKFRIQDIKSTNPVAVGDHVEFSISEENDAQTGLITNIIERKNYIIRKSTNLSKQSHIIASNIDQAFLVVTVNFPVTTSTFIDRFLASAEAYRISCILIFNKIDRYSQTQTEHMESLISVYSEIGYRCLKISARKNIGIDELQELMKNKTNVFSGHSGVGKSTIINTIQPGLNLKTKEISDSHFSGKHTTTFSEMFELDFGGFIIDTPGIKGFGMLEMESWEISHYFPEMFKLLDGCQYYNCSHTHEPGCAVKNAVAEGKIAKSRYVSYLGLLEDDEKYRN
ncbi:MAG: ribosome small subunit-dependent GTPase A [Bacteroidetes bacterium GWF2_42_66]|nr:MAG: ribosome small subunit-dependent GTPase A [Bacteroidetes bacterium GWA2_42_15]OFX97959.1 MAG: ribosome small subunit-dependent GTPase A [Bacteroidetes bacterium GWE2_42_39]OFY45804.1 MAG: ribosome small subunit-dependent GTPase A [Bacteroidetes bacterium GWF2_42_66]HBL74696.1 ribosome small subunit-dependent GTPase A [Prolixibacteraceae bacterium]HCR89429.1 ribosome small subunit-dependent GTPase A [Prolixibacteraceae bacterium]